MLEARDLACVRGERTLFSRISFRVEPGAVCWVSGGNGAGKTSLLRILCGLSRPEAGQVRWEGQDIQDEREEFHRELLYLGHLNALKDDLTAEENLAFSPQVGDGPAVIEQQLGMRGLSTCANLPARVLSQGQKRRVALARLPLGTARRLWILDEPFAALDVQAVADLAQLIMEHARRGGMVVLTSHQDVALGEVPVHRLELSVERSAP